MTSSVILRTVVEKLTKLLEGGWVDSYLLVDFLKVLRHARYEDVVLCKNFSKFLKADSFLAQNSMDLIRCAHYAAFFASSRYYDRQLFCEFEKVSLIAIEASGRVWKTRPKSAKNARTALGSIRMKDLARILWSFGEVMHLPTNEALIEASVRYIACRSKKGHCQNFPPDLHVDCLHSLAIMGVFPDEFNEWVVQLEKLEASMSPKTIRKMFVIRESFKIEKSSCWRPSDPSTSQSNKVMHQYSNLGKICNLVAKLCNGNEAFFRCLPILSHIPIPGLELCLDHRGELCSIETSENKVRNDCHRVAVEVLEPTRCLQNNCQPVGLWHMKIRQLEKLGYTVVKVMPSQVANLEEMPASRRSLWFKQRLLDTLGTSNQMMM